VGLVLALVLGPGSAAAQLVQRSMFHVEHPLQRGACAGLVAQRVRPAWNYPIGTERAIWISRSRNSAGVAARIRRLSCSTSPR